ncbi:putative major facilitator, sugar transporter [Helianthus anomalus]
MYSLFRWRICFWLSTIPSTVLALAMIFCAESPHWLYKVCFHLFCCLHKMVYLFSALYVHDCVCVLMCAYLLRVLKNNETRNTRSIPNFR